MKHIAVVLLVVLATLPCSAGETENTMDENKDGRPDLWFDVQNGAVVGYRADRNFDGKVDYAARYEAGDMLLFEEFDYNFDGVMDDFYYYEEGVLVRQEIDTNFDTTIDMWIYIEEGLYVRKIERDKDFDGVIDSVKDFQNR